MNSLLVASIRLQMHGIARITRMFRTAFERRIVLSCWAMTQPCVNSASMFVLPVPSRR